MRHRWIPPALALLALLAPQASAATVELHIDSAHSVAPVGMVTVELPGGGARIFGDHVEGTAKLAHVTGSLRISTWTTTRIDAPTGKQYVPQTDAHNETFDLHDATLTIALDREIFGARIVMNGSGELRVAGHSSARGTPLWLPRPVSHAVEIPWPLPGEPDVNPQWDAGWPFVGEYDNVNDHFEGFPTFPAPALEVDGPGAFQFTGGNLSVTAAGATVTTARLGNWSDLEGPAIGALPAVHETWRVAHLEATVANATLPVGDTWGLSAPTFRWDTQGSLQWSHATGTARVDGRTTAFRDATLALTGEARVAPARLLASAVTNDARYDADAPSADLAINSERTSGAPSTVGPPVVAGTALAVVLALLAILTERGGALTARLILPLYSRLTRSDLLAHPTRAAIATAIDSEPGIHLRELQRKLARAWGPFSFHLRMLERHGAIELRREGRFVAAYPVGAPAGGLVHHPLARAILAAVPDEGPIALTDLVQRTGASRQLVSYHLDALESSGALRSRIEAGRRVVERAASALT